MKPLHLTLMALACTIAATQTHAEPYPPSAPVYGYDYEGRLIQVENPASSAVFDYRATTLDGEDYDAVLNISDPSATISCFLVMGDNGLVSTARVIETVGDEFTELYTADFDYDANGRLVEITKEGFLGQKSISIDTQAPDYATVLAAEGVEMPYLRKAGLIDSSIARVRSTETSDKAVYDINGGMHSQQIRGINITHNTDGTFTKSLRR